MTKYTFNQIGCFFTFSIYRFHGLMDTPVKQMNNKFLVPANIYVGTGYFIGFTFLDNVVLLVFASHLS